MEVSPEEELALVLEDVADALRRLQARVAATPFFPPGEAVTRDLEDLATRVMVMAHQAAPHMVSPQEVGG